MKYTLLIYIILSGLAINRVQSAETLIPQITDRSLCSDADPDFDAYYYREHVARCKRSVGTKTKRIVALAHGVDPSTLGEYQVDHIFPLCAGGSNSEANLWPQPLKSAHEKDKLEHAICRKMDRGELTQKGAIDQISRWLSTLR